MKLLPTKIDSKHLLWGFSALLSATLCFFSSDVLAQSLKKHDDMTPRHPVPAAESVILMPNRIAVPPMYRGQVQLKNHEVSVSVSHHVATTTVTQSFYNECHRGLEAQYLFPLPENAQVTNMTLTVNGKTLEPKLLGKDEARTEYLTILHQMIDPGLLEYMDNKTIKLSVGPFFPKETKTIKITYQQPLKTDGGLTKYQYYWGNTSGNTASIAEKASLNLNLETEASLKTIYSPSHTVKTERVGANKATVSLSLDAAQRTNSNAFVLYFNESQDKVALGQLAYEPKGKEDGYFLLTLRSPLSAEKQSVISKNIVLILDNSGSMAGDKLKQAKEALVYILKHLNPADRFNVVVFNSDVRHFKKELQTASPETIKEAVQYVEAIHDEASTNIEEALKEGFGQIPNDPERPDYVVFLTDGEPTVGVTDTPGLIKIANEANKHHAKVFPFGVGYDVRTPLLNQLASDHHGSPTYVEPNENLELVLSQFYNKMTSPVLTDVSVQFDGDITVDRMYPKHLDDLFIGSEMVVLGRYHGKNPKGTVVLKGQSAGKPVSYSYPFDWTQAGNSHSFMPKLWAGRRIGGLLTEIADHGENNELKNEIIALSKQYAIITPYTSYLAVEKDADGRRDRALAPGAAPMSSMADMTAQTGVGNVKAYKAMNKIQQQANVQEMEEAQTGSIQRKQVQTVQNKTFVQNEAGVWVDTAYEMTQAQNPNLKPQQIAFGSDEYVQLLKDHPDWLPYLALGQEVLIVSDQNEAIQIVLPKS